MLLTIALATASELPPPAHWPNGNDACPCIDPFGADNSSSALALGANTPNTSTASCHIARSDNGMCYSDVYGSHGCQRYDWDATPECAEQADRERPAWCAAQWCYIDTKNCMRNNGLSHYFNDATWNGAALSYSYETCGYVDNFALLSRIRSVAAAQPQGKLRIGFPSDSGEGFALVGSKRYPDGSYKVQPGMGVGGTNRSGSAMVFMDEILQAIDVPWQEGVAGAHAGGSGVPSVRESG